MAKNKRGTKTLWQDGWNAFQPLAVVLRPKTLQDVVGQDHLLGKGKLLRRSIEADMLGSMLFIGKPGTGKTTLAEVIAATTKSRFVKLSAVMAGIADIKEVVEEAKNSAELYKEKTILFVDEIHRFNKSQQDALLPWVESGMITLIGATTENPTFEINKALLSRLKIFALHTLTKENLAVLVGRAVGFYKTRDVNLKISQAALEYWCELANGDARSLLNAIELVVKSTQPIKGVIEVDKEMAQESMQQRMVSYDKGGDEHYDTISAFIKSMRGSDVDASLYWLAKMVLAGEEPKFIARRMVILASEDVGNADPKALWLAVSAFQAIDVVGWPEAEIILAQVVAYLAAAPKSNAAVNAINAAKEAVEKGKSLDVPKHLKDSHVHGSEAKNYKYPHDFPNAHVKQQYLPDGVEGGFYIPTDYGYEELIKRRLKDLGLLEE